MRPVGERAHQNAVGVRKRICIVVSSIGTVEAFLIGHLAAMSRIYDVCVIANCHDRDYLRRRGLAIDVLYAPLVRHVSPLKDLTCLFVLLWMLGVRQFDIVHSVTPKAGLLGMLAAALAGIPVRVHTFTGQVWATRKGASRILLKALDHLLADCATHILVDSHSQMQFLLEQRVISQQRSSGLANGSICGVDIRRFRPEPGLRALVRTDLGIPLDAVVFVFMGRLKKDKGVLDLAAAFARVCETTPDIYLAFVGTDEEDLRPLIKLHCASCMDRLRFVDWTATPESYMTAADLLCLPSYREGFGNVILEAAACEVPSLASRIYGVSDAVVDEITGVLHAPGDVQALASAMQRVLRKPEWRIALGKRARVRAQELFADSIVTSALLQFYDAIFLARRREVSDQGVLVAAAGRYCDLVLTFVALVLCSPVFAGIGIATLVSMGPPILFRQTRIGWRERPFLFYKFRTMTDARDARGELLPDAERLTRLGQLLRRLSLDELPQLWNVLKGDMSLVGPRPLLPQYLPRYSPSQRRRHEVKPGITGWAQIHGRNSLSWEAKFEYDRWYVAHRSLWLDLKILAITIKQVLRRDGISQRGHATAQEFLGTEGISTAK